MMRTLLLTLLFVTTLSASAENKVDYPSLWDSSDPALQRQLKTIMGTLGYDRAISDKRLAVVLVDITRLHKPRVAALNGNTMIYAASVPKLAILLGAFVEIREGNMALDDTTRDSLTQMIRYSSNVEATRMLNLVGKERLRFCNQKNLICTIRRSMAGSGLARSMASHRPIGAIPCTISRTGRRPCRWRGFTTCLKPGRSSARRSVPR
jgi:hypothetical protein